MKNAVRLEAFYPHPPDKVWDALTDAKAIGEWLMPTDLQPLIGFRFRFQIADGGTIKGKVTDVERGRLLAYTWEDEDGQPSLVAWQLTPKDGGTEVRLEHVQLEEPEVNCLVIETHVNWLQALRRLRQLLRHLVVFA
jgi:uncharacterized protein YndB with AHSA1/START domain